VGVVEGLEVTGVMSSEDFLAAELLPPIIAVAFFLVVIRTTKAAVDKARVVINSDPAESASAILAV